MISVPKRHRSRTRARGRSFQPAPSRERIEASPSPLVRPAGRYRGAPVARTTTLNAAGEASPALERAAGWERTYVLKDFRRLGIMVVLMTALLAASGAVVGLLLR